MAELEKLGAKYRVALKIAKDPRFERLPCAHKGILTLTLTILTLLTILTILTILINPTILTILTLLTLLTILTILILPF